MLKQIPTCSLLESRDTVNDVTVQLGEILIMRISYRKHVGRQFQVIATAPYHFPTFQVTIGTHCSQLLVMILHPSCKPHLVTDELRTVNYVRHFHAFQVEPLSVRSVVVTTPCKLADYSVVGNYQPFHSCMNLVYLKVLYLR